MAWQGKAWHTRKERTPPTRTHPHSRWHNAFVGVHDGAQVAHARALPHAARHDGVAHHSLRCTARGRGVCQLVRACVCVRKCVCMRELHNTGYEPWARVCSRCLCAHATPPPARTPRSRPARTYRSAAGVRELQVRLLRQVELRREAKRVGPLLLRQPVPPARASRRRLRVRVVSVGQLACEGPVGVAPGGARAHARALAAHGRAGGVKRGLRVCMCG